MPWRNQNSRAFDASRCPTTKAYSKELGTDLNTRQLFTQSKQSPLFHHSQSSSLVQCRCHYQRPGADCLASTSSQFTSASRSELTKGRALSQCPIREHGPQHHHSVCSVFPCTRTGAAHAVPIRAWHPPAHNGTRMALNIHSCQSINGAQRWALTD